MPIHVYLFALLAVAAVPLFVYSMRGMQLSVPTRRRRAIRTNLGATTSASVPNLRQVVLSQSAATRIGQGTMAWLSKTARRVTPEQLLSGLERKRQLAGASQVWTMERLLAAKLVLAGAGAMVGLAVVSGNPSPTTFLCAAIFTASGFYGPDIALGARGRERQKEIQREFPGVLDQLTICVEAGLGLDAAMDRAARSGKGPLAEELTHVLQDIQLGASRQDALEAMVARTDVPDIRHFVVSLGQANRYGVPIVNALRVQATEAREQRRTRAEERAQRLSVKLLFPLIFCILPSLFVVLLGPAAIRISHLHLG